jgi:hypothetical protein
LTDVQNIARRLRQGAREEVIERALGRVVDRLLFGRRDRVEEIVGERRQAHRVDRIAVGREQRTRVAHRARRERADRGNRVGDLPLHVRARLDARDEGLDPLREQHRERLAGLRGAVHQPRGRHRVLERPGLQALAAQLDRLLLILGRRHRIRLQVLLHTTGEALEVTGRGLVLRQPGVDLRLDLLVRTFVESGVVRRRQLRQHLPGELLVRVVDVRDRHDRDALALALQNDIDRLAGVIDRVALTERN